jgi:extracellular matrix regulatory protein B
MFVHIGDNVVIPTKDLIAIIDIDSTSISEDTKQFLKTADEDGFVRRITKDNPKSFVLAEINKKSVIYLSPISSMTLCKRSGFVDTL